MQAGNPRAHLVATTDGRIDPLLVFDPSGQPVAEQQPELDLAPPEPADAHPHAHADAVTVTATNPVDPARLLRLLEEPPADVYRLKGGVRVATAGAPRRHLVNLVGRQIHVTDGAPAPMPDALVAIGMHLDRVTVRARLEDALAPADSRPTAAALRRLLRYRRLSA